jgi:cyclohexanone monooxygenase
VPDFPNLLTITGPKGPFSNLPPALEIQVEFIISAIQHAEQGDRKTPIEATNEAEQEYSALCDRLAASSLFWKAAVSENRSYRSCLP